MVLDRYRRVQVLQRIARVEFARPLKIVTGIRPAGLLRLMRDARSRVAGARGFSPGGAGRLLRVTLGGTGGQKRREAGTGQNSSQLSLSSVRAVYAQSKAPGSASVCLARTLRKAATNLWPGRLDGYNWRLTTKV